MDIVLLMARLALAAVFILAGGAKLADLPGSRKAVAGFGVPERFAPTAGLALPVAEFAIGVALIPTATAWWGALGGLALLLAFIGAIGYNLAQGRTPDCHCFGQLHSAPAGWPTIARNAGLAVIAVVILVAGWRAPGASAVAWLGDLSGIDIVLVVGGVLMLSFLGVLGWAVVNLMSQNGRLLTRLDALEAAIATGDVLPSNTDAVKPGLAVGMPAPAFTLPDLDGNTVTLDFLRTSGVPLMLLFTDPGCGPCNQILRQVNRWREVAGNRLDIAVISRGSTEANQSKAREHNLDRILLQPDPDVSQAYGVQGTPAAVIVDPDGTIGSSLAGGIDAIQTLVASILEPASAPAAHAPAFRLPNLAGEPVTLAPLAVGEAVPSIVLASLDGDRIDLADDSPTDRVLLFWNPGCGFCQRMVDDLRAWEAHRAPTDPSLVIVAAGDAEATRAHGFASTVLLDGEQGVGRRFGAHGTPAAVRIDTEGRVASPVATGAAVLGLVWSGSPVAANGHPPA